MSTRATAPIDIEIEVSAELERRRITRRVSAQSHQKSG
jgi:hypothetical protein